ncbi:MAG: alpha/beta hydrolase [Thiotrichaceae bacterium]
MHKTLFVYLLLSVILFLNACSTIPAVEDQAIINHVIPVSRDGQLGKIVLGKATEMNAIPRSNKRSEGAFDHILMGIRSFQENPKGDKEILIYIHGGLNTRAAAMNRARSTYKHIKLAKKYPVFINWRSGPFETYSSHLTRIRHGEISPSARYTAPIYLLTDIGNTIINAPKSWLVTGTHSLESTATRDDSYLDRYKGDNNVLYTGNGDNTSIRRRAQWIATAPLKLVSTPFTYTMAKPAWDIMLRRTNTLFTTPVDYENPDHSTEPREPALGTGALSAFLQELQKLVKKDPNITITLVGHSMGAIAVNSILAMGLDLPIRNIVHMGSADSIRNLFNKVIPYLANHPESKFYSLSLHPDNEDREVTAHGAAPSGSLLVWIDNMYTTPETVMDKRSGRWENIDRILPIIPTKVRKNMHFKIFGLNGENMAHEHGEFDNLEFWKRAIWWR